LNQETIAALNAVNRSFYRAHASEFSATRERGWAGWGELFGHVAPFLPRGPAVLDVGCGNGRFARFLFARPEIEGAPSYWGVDASPPGLEEAGRRLSGKENVFLFEHDFVVDATPLPAALAGRRFDLVVLFGVLHHVPGRSKRSELLARLEEALAPGGLLAYTLWRFDRYERFRKKLVPWEEFVSRTGSEIDLSELEAGDHIMTWGSGGDAFRYCHAASDEEEDSLAATLCSRSMGVVAQFEVQHEPNRYWLLQRSVKEPPLDGGEAAQRQTGPGFEHGGALASGSSVNAVLARGVDGVEPPRHFDDEQVNPGDPPID
jgi:SAM-dependent methyltransferase